MKRGRLLVLVLALVAWPAEPARAAATDPIAHDPTLIKQGAYYYDVITGDSATNTYLPLRRSRDLVHWEFLGTVFATPPAWVVTELGTAPKDFWAPDIRYFNGRYHLYYAASQFATNNSVIGLATARTLDPTSPDYGWTDQGMVLKSGRADDFNAIDPDLVFDERGQLWMAFGSFWSGLKLRRLDPVTGKLSADDQTLYPLAKRPAPGAVEGPSIVRRGGFYYLFASFDFCCRGVDSDYRVMVGRSRSVTGPYVDRRGAPMLEGGGTELLRGYNEFTGPGHGDVYRDRGVDWFAHHYYDRDDPDATPRLSVRAIDWRGGWPELGDPLSGSREPGRGPAFMKIVNRNRGALLDNPTCGYEGADIRLGADRRSPCARWRIEDRGNGWASLNNRHSNKVAEAAGCATANGADVAQWGWLNNACQRFRFIATGDGFVRIENERSGRVLDAAGCGGAGANVQLWDWLGNACQQFRLEPAGRVLLLGVDVRGCRTRCQWDFEHTELGYSTVTERRSGRALVARHGVLRLGGRRRRAAQWSLTPRNDDTFTLGNRAGDEYRVKVVVPNP